MQPVLRYPHQAAGYDVSGGRLTSCLANDMLRHSLPWDNDTVDPYIDVRPLGMLSISTTAASGPGADERSEHVATINPGERRASRWGRACGGGQISRCC